HRLAAQGDSLTALTVVVEGHLIFERSIEIGVQEPPPPVGRLDHDDGKDIGVVPIAVQVPAGSGTEVDLPEKAPVPGAQHRHPADPARSAERMAPKGDVVTVRRERRECDLSFSGEIPLLDDLRRAGAGRDEPGNTGIYTGVENADDDPASIVGRVRRGKAIHAGAPERE